MTVRTRSKLGRPSAGSLTPADGAKQSKARSAPDESRRIVFRMSRGKARAQALEGRVETWWNGRSARRRQTEKLDPQPQPDAALGLVTWKAAPPSDST